MASQVPAKKNTAFNLGLSLYLNTGALVTNPGTITAKISKDFGDYADVGTVTEEDSTYGQIKLALTNTEMNADVVMIYVVDNTSGCVPFTCTIYTAANLMDDIKTDTENNYAILNHADYGNAKLVRSTTPANTLTVDVNNKVAVPDTQDVNVKTFGGETLTAQIIAAWKKFFNVASPTGNVNSLPDAVPGANGGFPTTNGTKINQTVDLTAGQSIACSDKTGFSLSATGADLILKSSIFVQAIVAAVNEFATYGLTALNTLLVTTGIKAASIPITAADIKTALEADGSKLDHLWEMTEDDGGVRRLTTNALELAPSGSGLDAEGVRTAIGLATANLDTQLGAIPTTAMRGTDNAATATNLAAVKAVIDAIKLKTDTLGGAGAIPWTYTVTDSTTGLPISDVDVWVTTDSAGTNVIATGKTTALGVVNFSLDAGTYYFWSQKSGVDFVNPDCESVTA